MWVSVEFAIVRKLSKSGSEPEVKVEAVMSSPVITVGDTETVGKAARLMKKNDIGSVVVMDKKGNPVGLLTERDVVRRVAAEDLSPAKVKVAKALTKPLAFVDASMSVTEAAKKMKQMKLRRLVVMKDNKLAGIITSNDIVDITPALIDVLAEKSKIAPLPSQRQGEALAGYCDRCGSWSDDLKQRDGSYICPDCILEFKREDEEL